MINLVKYKNMTSKILKLMALNGMLSFLSRELVLSRRSDAMGTPPGVSASECVY